MQIKPGLEAKVESLRVRTGPTMTSLIGIDFQVYDTERVVARMPVNEKTRQPFGILHGGASVALAETLASVGAWLNVDESKFDVVGLEINANHIRATRDGAVIGTGLPLHRGRTTQVWEVRIETEDGKLVCMSRCTLAVVAKRA